MSFSRVDLIRIKIQSGMLRFEIEIREEDYYPFISYSGSGPKIPKLFPDLKLAFCIFNFHVDVER